tara:strand:- start:94 stop:216 length:123 start_codon:yes stop_codon:yes gene_type:complete
MTAKNLVIANTKKIKDKKITIIEQKSEGSGLQKTIFFLDL